MDGRGGGLVGIGVSVGAGVVGGGVVGVDVGAGVVGIGVAGIVGAGVVGAGIVGAGIVGIGVTGGVAVGVGVFLGPQPAHQAKASDNRLNSTRITNLWRDIRLPSLPQTREQHWVHTCCILHAQ